MTYKENIVNIKMMENQNQKSKFWWHIRLVKVAGKYIKLKIQNFYREVWIFVNQDR